MFNQNEFFKELKVVELASVLAGPAVGMFFAELGAQVIKIENKQGGDVTRSWKNMNESKDDVASAYYYSVNWMKKVLQLDLTDPQDREELHHQLMNADVLITNFKSGDDIKFQLKREELTRRYPKLIIGEIHGYSNSDKVAFDAVLQAETGFMAMNGTPDSGPVKMPIAMIDILAAHQLKEGILLALIYRLKSTKGSVIKVSLFDTAISSLANQASNWLNSQFESPRMGSLHPNIAPYGETFNTRDDKLLLLAIGNDRQFKSFCRLIGAAELSVDDRFAINSQRVLNRTQLSEIIASRIIKGDLTYWLTLFEKYKIPSGAVNNISEVFQNAAAQKKIVEEIEADGRISKRVETIAFKINYGN
ncbi:MAG: CaiB/BaiF CoA transferase family protein [Bacteroidota bacterium]